MNEEQLAEKRDVILTMPLMDEQVAYLRLHVPMSQENFEYLMEQLRLFKRGLVAPEKAAEV